MSEIQAYIETNGNDQMKTLARYLETATVPSGFCPFSPVHSKFVSVFPYPSKVDRFHGQTTKKELLAIAAVYLFIEQNHKWQDDTTLIGLHDRIKDFFENDASKPLEATSKNPHDYILLMDLSGYYQIWKKSSDE